MRDKHNRWAVAALWCSFLSFILIPLSGFYFIYLPQKEKIWGAWLVIFATLIGTTSIVLAIIALKKRHLGGVAQAWSAFIVGIFDTVIGGFASWVSWQLARSCGPAVYSFNGEEFVFDSEPYAGAILVQQTRYSTLNHLTPVDGQYRIKMMNELNEIQYTNQLKLLVVEHPLGIDVVPDITGQIHTIRSPFAPTCACQLPRTDILHLLKAKGGIFWESAPSEKNFSIIFGRREKLILEFPKPASATRAKLVLRVSNTFWSSSVSSKFLKVFGNSYLVMSAVRFLARKGFIRFAVQAWENGGWKIKGWVRGASPHLPKEQVILLDVSAISGECLKLRLMPAVGFWRIYSAEVDYSDDIPVKMMELDPAQAVNHCGEDIRQTLTADDDNFYAAEKGDCVMIAFNEPLAVTNAARSFILKAKGYYKMPDSPSERMDPIFSAPARGSGPDARLSRPPSPSTGASIRFVRDWRGQ
jgi:hypothetical protein